MLPQLGGGLIIILGVVLLVFVGSPFLNTFGIAMIIGALIGIAYTTFLDGTVR